LEASAYHGLNRWQDQAVAEEHGVVTSAVAIVVHVVAVSIQVGAAQDQVVDAGESELAAVEFGSEEALAEELDRGPKMRHQKILVVALVFGVVQHVHVVRESKALAHVQSSVVAVSTVVIEVVLSSSTGLNEVAQVQCEDFCIRPIKNAAFLFES